MTKLSVIFPITIILATLACGSTTPKSPGAGLSTPEPASAMATSLASEANTSPAESPAAGTESGPGQGVPAPTGLRAIYIREGNLWSWTAAGGSVQITGSGDMSTARLSEDGQLLAFMRGREVWTVRMDGTDAHRLVTQADEGGALWFAPGGSLLAVSTQDHIDVIDLNTSGSNTVATYPMMPEGCYPEVVWSPDASGFKTVVPLQAGSGQAELLYVFTDGTRASLAKFALVPLSESLPFFSPDGGYVIYVAKAAEGRQSLYLMDSSGATKPYGEAAERVHAYAWLPDSKRFVFALENPPRAFLGEVGGPPLEITLAGYQLIRWVDGEHFLALQDGSLFLGDVNGGKTLIAVDASDFDFEK